MYLFSSQIWSICNVTKWCPWRNLISGCLWDVEVTSERHRTWDCDHLPVDIVQDFHYTLISKLCSLRWSQQISVVNTTEQHTVYIYIYYACLKYTISNIIHTLTTRTCLVVQFLILISSALGRARHSAIWD